ncbi:unnamed protein product [Strongylus vulgaris]|uniref:Superoxide dismutase [Cu-Zn] n=1 Tax=Strongylus vulgaris TaxID=40348 RepID=A0A3P7IMM4_STRVU|nr:unnamed protein product [Strongylus vulgaris]
MLVVILLIIAAIHLSECCLFGIEPLGIIKARAVIYRAVPGGNPTTPIGVVDLTQIGCTLAGTIYGLTPGLHGFHVHEIGNLGNGCLAAGSHFNPANMTHGAPSDSIRHVGDLGNVKAQVGTMRIQNIFRAIRRTITQRKALKRSYPNTLAHFFDSGVAAFYMYDSQITLNGPNNIVGKTLVIHDNVDDLGRGNHPDSKTTGNAGGRFGCGIIKLI